LFPRPLTRPLEPRHDLHMRRKEKLIDGGHLRELVAAVEQDTGVPRQRARIAGDRNHRGYSRCRKRVRLRRCAFPRRIEHDGIEPVELFRAEWPPEEIAHLHIDRFEALRVGSSAPHCLYRERIVVDRRHAGALGKAQCKRSSPLHSGLRPAWRARSRPRASLAGKLPEAARGLHGRCVASARRVARSSRHDG
jgi:hypothetical protein